MEQKKDSAVSIAGLHLGLQGSLPIFDDFVCPLSEKSDGQIYRVENAVLDASFVLDVEHDEVNVYSSKNGDRVFVYPKCEECVQVSLSADYKEIKYYIVPTPDERAFDSILRGLFRMAIESIYFNFMRLSLHSACIDIDGQAVAFTGVSGLGKSTRAAAWVTGNGADFISGDRPSLALKSGEVVAYGVPWDGKEQIFNPVQRPLKAILEVRRSKAVYLRKLDEKQAVRLLVKQVFIPMWDSDAAAFTISNIKKLVKSVPVYRLFCGPDEDDAKEAYRLLFNDIILEATKDMKIKDGFALRTVADEYIVMPTGGNIADFDGAIALNEVSAFLFNLMLNPISKEDLVVALLNEYDVEQEVAQRDVDALVSKFADLGILE